MRPVLSREQMRAFDAHAIKSGVPGIVLMENAGRGAAHLLGLSQRPRDEPPATAPKVRGVRGSCVRCADENSLSKVAVAIVAGPGNNGGDGFVLARHLLSRGAHVEVFLCADQEAIRGDARIALSALRAVGGTIVSAEAGKLAARLTEFGVVVDALLGTGVSRQLGGALLDTILAINGAGRPVFALDLPSGLDADTGQPWGAAVRAEHTVSFGHLKAGLLTTTGYAHAGRLTISGIGVPAALPAHICPSAHLLEESDVRTALRPRAVGAHKSSVGRVVVAAGSAGKTGAAQLAGCACLRAGAGLVTLLAEPPVTSAAQLAAPELMSHTCLGSLDQAGSELVAQADALVVGPGLGRTPAARERVRELLAQGRPTILDADGLRAFEGELRALRQHPALVLTPHAAEAAGLLGITTDAVEADRFLAVRRLAEESGGVVVLKGPRTLIAEPGGRVLVSAFGSPALATGGTGDVLAGVLGALLAQAALGSERHPSSVLGRDAILTAAWLGVALHGLAAEAWSLRGGDAGLLASELMALVPEVRARLLA